jgi:chemotaxis response regulator CheB
LLRRILESQLDWEVVAEACDGKDAISKVVETKPDVAVLGYSMPLINGIEATRQIRARLPTTEVLLFTIHDRKELIQECLKAGARGYVLKSDVAGDGHRGDADGDNHPPRQEAEENAAREVDMFNAAADAKARSSPKPEVVKDGARAAGGGRAEADFDQQ